jgi:hypothetical protein
MTDYEYLAAIAEEMKDIAKKHDIVVWTAKQARSPDGSPRIITEEEMGKSIVIMDYMDMIQPPVYKPKLKIRRDPDPQSPRGHNVVFGLMVCWHSKHKLGDIQPNCPPDEWTQGNLDERDVELPLYLFDHSGITMRTEPFACRWDSGQVGWIRATVEEVIKEFGDDSEESKEKARKVLQQEVSSYDLYLRGEVWGYEYGDDSCWGFYGDTLEETGILEHLPAGLDMQQSEEAWDTRK